MILQNWSLSRIQNCCAFVLRSLSRLLVQLRLLGFIIVILLRSRLQFDTSRNERINLQCDDSSITPGTPFLQLLAGMLYVCDKD